MDRREFLQTAGACALTARAVASPLAKHSPKPMRLLILGGTKFIGIHMTQLALDRGHTVTLFNRGKTNTELFPQVEHLHGDRDAQLDSLRGRKWDAVIDDSGFVPRHVRLSAELLAPNVGQYLFISTISVYASLSKPVTEDSPVGQLKDQTVEKVGPETYGPLKALSEKAAMTAMPGRATVFRPGLIVGPDDSTDRFTYWPARAARGGEMLAPGTPQDPIQFIDARDLAAFALLAVETRIFGTYNVISPPGKFTMGQLVTGSIDAANEIAKPNPPPHAVWASAEFLEKEKVEAWSDMPAWIPESGDTGGAMHTSDERARRAGLTVRPIAETIRDTLVWHLKRPKAEQASLKAGLTADREQKVLSDWHALNA